MGSKYSTGSVWRKWDLHVHTPASYDWHGGTVTADEIINTAKSCELEIIAVTDHHSVAWIDSVRKAAENHNITVLPGIELRTDKGNKGIHIIGVFSESTEAKVMYDKVLAPLGFSEADIKSKGDDQVYCDFEDACKLMKEMGGLIFLHAGDKHCGIEQLANDARSLLKKDMAGLVDILEVCDSSELQEYNQKVFPNVGRVWPIVITSDSVDRSNLTHKKGHSLDVIGKKFTWIKAAPTFEGLKQIIYEPDLRIKIQPEDPCEKETYTRIEKCVVKLPSSLKIHTEESKKTDFCLQDEYEFEFSNNLTSIIGGRGSGKSTLIHLLYNAWRKKDVGKLDDINSPLLSLDLRPDPLSRLESITTTEIPEQVEFFLQNEIEKFARDIDEMSTLIRHRLTRLSSLNAKRSLKDLQNNWDSASASMVELIIAYDSVSEAVKKIEALRKQIDTLKKQTAVIKSEEYKNFQKQIDEINDKISVFKRYKSEYTSLIKEIDVLIALLMQFVWGQEQGKDILESLIKSLHDHKEKLTLKFTERERTHEANKYLEQLASQKLQLKQYLEEKGLSPENIVELADASERIKELEDEIRSLEREKEPHENIYHKRDAILKEYKNKYDTYQDRFFEVASQLERELKNLPFFDKEISFTPKTNTLTLKETAVDFVKRNSPAKVTLRADDIQNVLFDVDDITGYLLDKNKIKTCVNKSSKTILHKQILQELVNDPVFLERLYLRMWKDYFEINNIQVQTKLGDKLLQNTSFGERCGIVISIVLVAGTNPIVIDQPEDNLDGKFIANVLVPLIRKQKQNRQIILVTRDANIVIGGDAELIHILENDGKKTIVNPSSIENTENRETYIWILDGGEEAFQKREQKYAFPRKIL